MINKTSDTIDKKIRSNKDFEKSWNFLETAYKKNI